MVRGVHSLVGLRGMFGVGAFFTLLVAVFGALFLSQTVQERVLTPFTEVLTDATSGFLNVAGFPTTADASGIQGPIGLRVGNDCNGAWAHLILTVAIFSLPSSSTLSTVIGLVGMNVILFLTNVLRIASLYLLLLYRPGLFAEAHVYIWQFLIILVAILLFTFWAVRIDPQISRGVQRADH